ncbi:MAG: F-type H+-transporting ATPase subunit a [Candidatus Sumerlaeota bacterium]|nr:F-type H+-transporting ATPase subunit a [Candidatus Sumerlaeota bacterium]
MAEQHAEESLHGAGQALHDTAAHAESAMGDAADGVHDAATDAHAGAVDAAHDVAHDAGAHAAPHYPRHTAHPPELPHFVQIWWLSDKEELEAEGKDPYGEPGGPYTLAQTLHVGRRETPAPFVAYAPWENNLFAAIAAIGLLGLFWLGTRSFRRNREDVMRRPTRGQAFMEMLVDGIDNFCKGILGEANGRRYLPYVAGMFFFVLALNFMGMIPLMKAPSSSILITGSLALCTFCYYMYTAVTRMGPLMFIFHLMGEPRSIPQWILAPLIFAIELISWLIAKPLSLALRLFGNILGKDILFGVMLMLGLMMTSGLSGPLNKIGVPLTYPFYFLGILLSAVQALIFALLSAIYILLVLPHDDHDHAEEHAH